MSFRTVQGFIVRLCLKQNKTSMSFKQVQYTEYQPQKRLHGFSCPFTPSPSGSLSSPARPSLPSRARQNSLEPSSAARTSLSDCPVSSICDNPHRMSTYCLGKGRSLHSEVGSHSCGFVPSAGEKRDSPLPVGERGRTGYLGVQIVAQLLSIFLLDT